MSFVKVINHQIEGNFWLGSCIRISVVLNVDLESGDTAKITIEDPSDIEKVTQATMTEEAPKVYSYVYQSDEDDNDGIYTVTVEITKGDYTAVEQWTFELKDPDKDW